MAKWKFDNTDRKIVFLIKTMKKRHLESTLKEGTFCFNCPTVFNVDSSSLAPAQQDQWDSYLSFTAEHIMYAPIISDDANGIVYDTPQKLADSAHIHQIMSVSKKTALCSFRKVEPADFEQRFATSIFRLGETVDRIKNEFEHDAFILVYQPHALIHKFSEVTQCFARSIHYGAIDQSFQDFLDSTSFDQKEMFQKRTDYSWQKEFRVILPPSNDISPQIIRIGSIEDIAFGGDIETLRAGYIFGENEDAIYRYISQMNTN